MNHPSFNFRIPKKQPPNVPSQSISPNESFHADINSNLISISEEYDQMRENFFCKDTINRSQWMENLFTDHPDIKEFRQRVMPVDRAIEFGNLYLPEERLINQETVFALISQHFHTLGMVDSQQALHQEWEGKFDFPISLDHSQLTLLIQRGIQNSENFWMLTTPGTMPKNEDEESIKKKVIEEFEKIIGKEATSEILIKDGSPIGLEEPGDTNKLILDNDYQISKATINQIFWIYTTDNQFDSKQIVKATCLLSSYLTKDPKIMFTKIRERFRIALKSETILHNININIKSKLQFEESEIDQANPDQFLNLTLNEESSESESTKESNENIDSKTENILSKPSYQSVDIISEPLDTENQIDEKDKEHEEMDSEDSITLPTTIETDPLTNQFKQIKKTLSLLSIWIDQCGPQIPLSVLSSVLSFIHNEVPEAFSSKITKIQSQIDQIIIQQKDRLSESKTHDKEDEKLKHPPKVELDSHHMPWSPDFEITMLPPIEFARQFTIFISHFFYNIKRCELVYSKDSDIELNQPNLNNLITKGNNFFRWIQFCVLSKSEIYERAALMTYFIKVAKKLYKIRNFYGCSLILNTFDNSFASLKATKALIAKKYLNFIDEAKNQIVNFDVDSSIIQQFFRDSLSKKPTIPVIFPYKSSIQSAIKGRLVEDDKVKIPVLLEIFKLVCEFEEFQKKKFNFYTIEQAQEIFENCNSPKTLNELIDYAKKIE